MTHRLIGGLGRVATLGAAALSLWACSEQASVTAPPRPISPTTPNANVVAPTLATAVLCAEGPAGTYGYSISLNIPAGYVVNGIPGTYSASDLTLVASAAYENITVGSVSLSAGTCQTVGTILQNLNFQNPVDPSIFQDPLRFLTITQTSAPAATALDFILTTEQGGSDVTIPSPATSATIDINFFHGAVASFWNTATPVGNQGCTPGYWKQSQHFDSWVGYTPSQLISSVFTVPAAYTVTGSPMGGYTLLQGLSFKGGSTLSAKAQILMRAAIAGLLSSTSVNYGMTTAALISNVNAALASMDENTILTLATQLDGLNNALGGCPLN
jgi:hypothetical protein